MNNQVRKVILLSKNGYSKEHDTLLKNLIDKKILLFCAVGKDCELWHDVMDELYVNDGEERDFLLLTTWHNDATFEEVVQFAKDVEIEGIDNYKIEVIQI